MVIALLLAGSLALRSSTDSARAVVAEAARAVAEGRGQAAARAWRQRLASTPVDSAAILALATISRLTYDYEAAEGLYDRAGASRPSATNAWSLYAALGVAENRLFRIRYDSSTKELERIAGVARARGATAVEAEALYWIVNMRYRAGVGPPDLSALRLVESRTPSDDWTLQARLHCLAAEMLNYAGKPTMLAEVKVGLAAAVRAHDEASEAHCLVYQALYLDIAQPSEFALALFDSALAKARHAHADLEEAVVLGGRGYVYGDRQWLRAALSDVDGCIMSAQRMHLPIIEAWCKYYRAAPRRTLGDRQGARSDIAYATGVFPKLGDHNGMMAVANFDGGMSLRDGRLDDAARAYRELRTVSAALHAVQWEEAGMIGLSQIHRVRGEWDMARRLLDSTRAFDRDNNIINPLDYLYGRIALGQGDLATARREFAAAFSRRKKSLPLLRYAPLARLAQVEALLGSLHAADSLLSAAEDELDTYRATLTDSQLRPLVFETGLRWEETPDLGIPTIIAALSRGGRAKSAFYLAERRRARELGDQLLAARQTFAGFTGTSRDAANVRQLASVAKTHTLVALNETTALLEYVTGREGQLTTLFALTAAGVRAYVLPPIDSLQDDVGRFATLIEAGGSARVAASRLGNLLLAPAVRDLPSRITHLIIVTDLGLHGLPFDALRLADGRLVLERFAVSFAPSASVLRSLEAQRGRAVKPIRILALGDPATSGVTVAAPGSPRAVSGDAFISASVYRGAFDSAGGLPPLPAAADEARSVAAFAPSAVVRLGADASEAWIKHAPLSDFRVIHFATHALVSESSVSRTAIALAPGSGEDGFLTATDIARLRLDADLVVLSACRTAAGVELRGEGVEGLTASLLQAGAQTVAATRWRVRDRSIVPLIKDFYNALADGLSVTDALRRAKLAALARGTSSQDWAAFTIIGDPDVRVPLAHPSIWRRLFDRVSLAKGRH